MSAQTCPQIMCLRWKANGYTLWRVGGITDAIMRENISAAKRVSPITIHGLYTPCVEARAASCGPRIAADHCFAHVDPVPAVDSSPDHSKSFGSEPQAPEDRPVAERKTA